MFLDLDPISGRAIQVALDIGLLEPLLSGPKTRAELAVVTGCAERGLRPLLYLLASFGILEIVGEQEYALAKDALRYIGYEWPAAWAAFPEIPEYAELERAVRTGRPIRSPVESSGDQGEFYAGVTPTLFDLHWPDAEYLADQIPVRTSKVLDLGAGSAVWSIALATNRPTVQVVAVDRARVLSDVTTGFLQAGGVFGNYELRPGDYHNVRLESSYYHLVYLGHLLHADGWDASRKLLDRSFKALAPGGQVAIAEVLGAEPRSDDYAANVFDLNMLMLTENGLVFTAAELEELVATSGFVEWEWIQGPGDYPVLLASKA